MEDDLQLSTDVPGFAAACSFPAPEEVCSAIEKQIKNQQQIQRKSDTESRTGNLKPESEGEVDSEGESPEAQVTLSDNLEVFLLVPS